MFFVFSVSLLVIFVLNYQNWNGRGCSKCLLQRCTQCCRLEELLLCNAVFKQNDDDNKNHLNFIWGRKGFHVPVFMCELLCLKYKMERRFSKNQSAEEKSITRRHITMHPLYDSIQLRCQNVVEVIMSSNRGFR